MNTPSRPTYPDGRIIPAVDDKVFVSVPGPFGTPAAIHGIVYQHRGKLRVRITGSGSILGDIASRKTMAMDAQWSVVGDPEFGRRREAREQREREAEQKRQQEHEQWLANQTASAARSLANGDTAPSPESVRVGDLFHRHYGEFGPEIFRVWQIETYEGLHYFSMARPDLDDDGMWEDSFTANDLDIGVFMTRLPESQQDRKAA